MSIPQAFETNASSLGGIQTLKTVVKLLPISSLNYFSPGGESLEHPSILYQFDFGSLTNGSLRQIERELIEVSVFLLHVYI